jgi:hypothetical protein
VSDYFLPLDFGAMIDLHNSDNRPLKPLEHSKIYHLTSKSDEGTAYYVYAVDGRYKIKIYPTPDTAETLTVIYNSATGYYSPTLGANQNWGWFDGNDFSDTIKLPQEYTEAIVMFVLDKLLGGNVYQMQYEQQLDSLKQTKHYNVTDSFTYHFGGLDEDEYDRTVRSESVITEESTSESTVKDQPTKIYRFSISEGAATGTELYSTGYGDITVTQTGTTITVTSADGEFTAGTFVDPNNRDLNWGRTDESEIWIDGFTGYGSAEIIIKDYE